eukprot:2126709-Amphidinium_carterae.1
MDGQETRSEHKGLQVGSSFSQDSNTTRLVVTSLSHVPYLKQRLEVHHHEFLEKVSFTLRNYASKQPPPFDLLQPLCCGACSKGCLGRREPCKICIWRHEVWMSNSPFSSTFDE